MADYRALAQALDPYAMDTGGITPDTIKALQSGYKSPNLLGMIADIGRGGLSNLESLVRGGVAQFGGTPVDTLNTIRTPYPMEVMGDVNYAPDKQVYGGTKDILGMMPKRVTQARPETAGMEELGTIMGPGLAKGVAPAVKGYASLLGNEINAGMTGQPTRSIIGQITPKPLQLDVYHGTPHQFPPTERNPLGEFDASKIGTGEGAQAYGHGIYTGGNIKTGEEYVKTTARTEIVDSSGNTLYKELPRRKITGESRAADALDYAFQVQSSNPYAFAANQITKFGEGPDVQDALKTLAQWEQAGAKTKTGAGYLYKADLPDEKIPQMLDWYYPVPEEIRQKVSSAALEKFGSGSTGTSGAHLYAELTKEFERLGSANPKVDASEFLRQQGVPGIKYLDNFSRRQPEWIIESPHGGQNIFNSEAGAQEFLQKNPEGKMIAPKQTYNYVMFPGEEKNIKILERQDR